MQKQNQASQQISMQNELNELSFNKGKSQTQIMVGSNEKQQKFLDRKKFLTQKNFISENEIKSTSQLGCQPKISQQQLKTFKRLQVQFRDFKTFLENKIQVKRPSSLILMQIIQTWKQRTPKVPSFILQLIIQELPTQMNKQEFIKSLQPFASIILTIDNVLIQNKMATHFVQDKIYYQGIENQYMMISKQLDTIHFYQGQVKGKLQHGNGCLFHITNYKVIYKYIGSFLDGKKQGQGTQHYPSKGIALSIKGITYIGQFKNDHKHGKGQQLTLKKLKNPKPGQNLYVQKNRYQGDYELGYRSGEGIELTSHGQYKGSWQKGMKNGFGIMKYKNGHSYQGNWVDDHFQGTGIYIQLITIDGQSKQNKYQGEYHQGYYSGKGTMLYYTGDKYQGQWAFGKKQGSGMYQWADGDYYDGSWEKDMKQGTGAACFGGVFYDGEFHLDMKHGLGEETDEEGNTTKAMWLNNDILKKLEINGEIVDQQGTQA